MHRLSSPGSICLTIYPMRIQKGINAGVTVIHNAGRLVKTCRDFLQSLSWGRAEEHNILSSDAFPNCLQPVQHQKRKRDQCLPSELCKTLQAPIEPGLCRREGYLRNFIGRSEVLFRWGGPRPLCPETPTAELCLGVRQQDLWDCASFVWTKQIAYAAKIFNLSITNAMMRTRRTSRDGRPAVSISCQHCWNPLIVGTLCPGHRSAHCWDTIDKEDVTCPGQALCHSPALIQSSQFVTGAIWSCHGLTTTALSTSPTCHGPVRRDDPCNSWLTLVSECMITRSHYTLEATVQLKEGCC